MIQVSFGVPRGHSSTGTGSVRLRVSPDAVSVVNVVSFGATGIFSAMEPKLTTT